MMGGSHATATADTTLTLPARPESVAIARHAIDEVGRRMAFPDQRMGDLRTVVSEACMNAAVHAYDGPAGQFELQARPNGDAVVITVTDSGSGIQPRPAIGSPSARLGLLLIAALSESVEISSLPGGGTRLQMRVARDRDD